MLAGLKNSIRLALANLPNNGFTCRNYPVQEDLLRQVLQGEKIDQASRPISIAQLHTLLRFHLQPINLVVYEGPSGGLTPRDI